MLNRINEILYILESIISESKKLSDEEKELLRQFRESSPGLVHPETSHKFKRSQARIEGYKNNLDNSDEAGRNILQGQIKREKKQNILRLNTEASEKQPDLKKIQKNKIWKFIRAKQANIGK